MSRRRYLRHLFRDALILAASIIVAILLSRSGAIESFVQATGESLVISSFLAGAFFTSVFTIAPAGVALLAIAETFSPAAIAFFGALGAMCVDTAILIFVRKDISRNLEGLARVSFKRHIIKAFHFGMLKWAAFIAGLLIIASPFPDEAGLFPLGVSKVNAKYLPIVFFVSNFLGIWALISVVQTF